MAGIGALDPWVVLVLATVGGTLGFMSMYAIGHRVGHGLLDEDRYRWLPKKQILKARERLKQQGFFLVAANRFLSGLRSVISLTVGMAHMDVGKTWFWSAFSALIWCALLTGAGVLVGENWEVVSGYLRTYGTIIMSLIALFVVVQVVRWRRSSKRSSGSASGDASIVTPESGEAD